MVVKWMFEGLQPSLPDQMMEINKRDRETLKQT